MGVALKGQRQVDVQGQRRASRLEILEQHQTPQRLSDLDVDEMRRVEPLLRIERALGDPLAAVGAQ
jgi:hypothetical protein